MKTRIFHDKNYKATYIKGKTLRFPIDEGKPVLELDYPEFYDISITNNCSADCSYCYQDSKALYPHFDNIINKVISYFGCMSANERPFQIAYGGGEPTGHPDFIRLLEKTHELGIVPNYTTNGMWATDGNISPLPLLEATQKYCGGVAISCHPHLKDKWPLAASLYSAHSIKLNFHIIISDIKSINYFKEIYDKWHNKVDTFVLLPYIPMGRAKNVEINYEYLKNSLPENIGKIAFGAKFYDYLKESTLKIHLYEPEIFSKYISLKGNGLLYPSSFSKHIIKRNLFLSDCSVNKEIIKELKYDVSKITADYNNESSHTFDLQNKLDQLNNQLTEYNKYKKVFSLFQEVKLLPDNLLDYYKIQALIEILNTKTLNEIEEFRDKK